MFPPLDHLDIDEIEIFVHISLEALFRAKREVTRENNHKNNFQSI